MSEVSSVIVTLDGESKCGKTTIAESIATHAPLNEINTTTLDGGHIELEEFTENGFDNVTVTSAGNSFIATTLLAS